MAAPSYVSAFCVCVSLNVEEKKKGGGVVAVQRPPPKGLDCGLGGWERGGTWGVKG